MKIKTISKDRSDVLRLAERHPVRHKAPKKPSIFFRALVRAAASADLRATGFSYTMTDGAKAALERPTLILMNHSSFIDLEIASKILFPKPYNIVCTSDGFVGKAWLMRRIGCIPTQKFVPDVRLIEDMKAALKQGCRVLMYPEASYTFDGCPTPLPEHLPGLFRILRCPVVMIRTKGAFLRDPLYNGLQKRKVRVSAEVSLLLSEEEAVSLPKDEIAARLARAFDFDGFAEQKRDGVRIAEPFRADGLERILYKCPVCGSEGRTRGRGIGLTCESCGSRWEMDEYGSLHAEGDPPTSPVKEEFARPGEPIHIPDWYRWERACVAREIDEGRYRLDEEVTIGMMVNDRAIYLIGDGRLLHDGEGFRLYGKDGDLLYTQRPLFSYGLYADYFWYEIGDMICIGNNDCLYYCFPKRPCPVAKARMAAEILYQRNRRALRSGEGAAE